MSAGVERAEEIARQAHKGQVKKTGGLVIDHVARVAAHMVGSDELIVAWLHDVVENSPHWTLARLRQEGFAEEVLLAVEALTKRPGEAHADLVRRAAQNNLARSVKLADLADNLAEAERTGQDASKYRLGLQMLQT